MRQVYYDPFGQYTEGYDKGAQRQQETERNVRDAREQDYKYRVLNPLQEQLMRNNVDLNTFKLPLEKINAQLGLRQEQSKTTNAELGTGRETALDTNSGYDYTEALARAHGGIAIHNGDDSTILVPKDGGGYAPLMTVHNRDLLTNLNYQRALGTSLTNSEIARNYGMGIGAQARGPDSIARTDITAGSRDYATRMKYGDANNSAWGPGLFGAPQTTQPTQPTQPNPYNTPPRQPAQQDDAWQGYDGSQ